MDKRNHRMLAKGCSVVEADFRVHLTCVTSNVGQEADQPPSEMSA